MTCRCTLGSVGFQLIRIICLLQLCRIPNCAIRAINATSILQQNKASDIYMQKRVHGTLQRTMIHEKTETWIHHVTAAMSLAATPPDELVYASLQHRQSIIDHP